jgi:hypothetical protein
MARPIFLAIVLLAAACDPGAPNDVVVYKPAPAKVEGRLRSRLLVVTPEQGALGVEKTAAKNIEVRTGSVIPDEWDGLRLLLTDAFPLRKEEMEGTSGHGIFQIFAKLGERKVRLARSVEETLEPEVAGARDRLERIWSSLTVPADPVTALFPFLDSPVSQVRGQAVTALLVAMDSPDLGPEDREKARARLRTHLSEEYDPELVELIRKGLTRPK